MFVRLLKATMTQFNDWIQQVRKDFVRFLISSYATNGHNEWMPWEPMIKHSKNTPWKNVKESSGILSLLGYTRKNLTTCSKSANKPSTSCVPTACYKLSTSLEQAELTTCNNLFDIIRLVTRLSQQVCHNHDITILLQPCAGNLIVTFLFYHDCIRLITTTL